MNRKSILALAVLTLAGAAQAATYNFTGSFDTAPTATVLNGSFSFDDAVVSAGGFDGDFSLTSLSFSFQGQTYTLAQATDPYVKFEGGTLTGPNGRFATQGGGAVDLFSIFGASNFNYAINGIDQGGTLSISAVPEPESYALMLGGLGVVGFLARRRKLI